LYNASPIIRDMEKIKVPAKIKTPAACSFFTYVQLEA
jgi:hypothetical protein